MDKKMNRKMRFLDTLLNTRVVTVIRTLQAVELVPAMGALAAGGVQIIEITSTTPGYLQSIKALREHFGDSDIFVGAGTILDAQAKCEAVEAGADFIVSPVFLPGLVRLCVDEGICVMPGCMTPTEIFGAWSMGADVIKTFPGSIVTPDIYKDLLGPFPGVRMMPTGNVNEITAPKYIKAGAVAVGVGKALASEEMLLNNRLDEITNNARKFSALVQP